MRIALAAITLGMLSSSATAISEDACMYAAARAIPPIASLQIERLSGSTEGAERYAKLRVQIGGQSFYLQFRCVERSTGGIDVIPHPDNPG